MIFVSIQTAESGRERSQSETECNATGAHAIHRLSVRLYFHVITINSLGPL